MITLPSFLPININKLKNFMSKKYRINIDIDGEFIEENLHDEYNYYIYKKGKKKNNLKIYKSNKSQQNKNISLKELKFNDNNDKDIILNIKLDDHIENSEIKNVEDKIKEIDFDNKNEYLDNDNKEKEYNYNVKKEKQEKSNIYDEYKYMVDQLNYVNINYEYLKILYSYLIEKHKNTYNFFVSLIMGIQKIYKEMKKFKPDNNIIKIKELEHEKMLRNIEKIIPQKELVLKLNF